MCALASRDTAPRRPAKTANFPSRRSGAVPTEYTPLEVVDYAMELAHAVCGAASAPTNLPSNQIFVKAWRLVCKDSRQVSAIAHTSLVLRESKRAELSLSYVYRIDSP
jgi:hypothetical protein